MAFDIFQTATGTMKKITTDEFGDPELGSGFEVEIDPDISWERTFDQEGEQIMGGHTVISPNDNIDKHHRKWQLEIGGNTYQVEKLDPKHDFSTNNISHFEVVIR